MSDDQFDILDEPEEPRKRKRKSKFRPLGVPWRWVLVAFAAGVGVVLLFIMPVATRLVPNDAMVVVPSLPPLPTLTLSPPPLPWTTVGSNNIEDIAWHGDTMAVATMRRLGLYQDLNWLGDANVYDFNNEGSDKYIDLAFSPDGTHLAAIQSKYQFQSLQVVPAAYVTIWNTNGDFNYAFSAHYGNEGGFVGPYLGVAIAYSHDGRFWATGAGEGEVVLWDATKYRPEPIGHIFTSATGTVALAFSDDGQHLTMLLRRDDGTYTTNWTDSGDIQLWNISNPKNPIKEPFTKHLQREVGLNTAISPDGRFVAFVDLVEENLCCIARALQIWDVHAGSLILEIPLDERGSTVWNLAFSEDSDNLTFTEQHVIEQENGYGILQNDLRVIGWQKDPNNEYLLQDIGGRFDVDNMPSNLHINEAGTWVQYIIFPYDTVERWYIWTDQIQDMSL